MYTIRMTKTFRRDTERCRKHGYNMELLKTAIRLLEANGELPKEYTSCRATMQALGSVTLKAIG